MRSHPIGTVPILSVSGHITHSDEFHVDLRIPIETGSHSVYTSGTSLNVSQMPYQSSKCDVLLGMDFLSLFHITLFGQQIILSN